MFFFSNGHNFFSLYYVNNVYMTANDGCRYFGIFWTIEIIHVPVDCVQCIIILIPNEVLAIVEQHRDAHSHQKCADKQSEELCLLMKYHHDAGERNYTEFRVWNILNTAREFMKNKIVSRLYWRLRRMRRREPTMRARIENTNMANSHTHTHKQKKLSVFLSTNFLCNL